MKVTAKSFAGNPYNEDRFIYGDDWFLLLDGATSLSKELISTYETNAIWLVENINYFIKNNISSEISTETLITNLTIYIKNEFDKLGVEFDKKIEPAAALMLVRIFEDTVEITSIGDCTVIVDTAEGVELVQDTRLKVVDDYALDAMIKIAKEKNIPNSEARPFITDILLENRFKRNKPNSYVAVDISSTNFKDSLIKIFDKSIVKNIYIFSDGVARFYEIFDLAKDYKDFKNILHEKDIDTVIKELRDIENSDLDYEKYPRFKKSDDATLGIIELNN